MPTLPLLTTFVSNVKNLNISQVSSQPANCTINFIANSNFQSHSEDFYRQQTKFGARWCFYTCLSSCSQVGLASQLASQVTRPGGLHPGGGGLHPGRGWADTPAFEIRSTSGRYASYWNTFLFLEYAYLGVETCWCRQQNQQHSNSAGCRDRVNSEISNSDKNSIQRPAQETEWQNQCVSNEYTEQFVHFLNNRNELEIFVSCFAEDGATGCARHSCFHGI